MVAVDRGSFSSPRQASSTTRRVLFSAPPRRDAEVLPFLHPTQPRCRSIRSTGMAVAARATLAAVAAITAAALAAVQLAAAAGPPGGRHRRVGCQRRRRHHHQLRRLVRQAEVRPGRHHNHSNGVFECSLYPYKKTARATSPAGGSALRGSAAEPSARADKWAPRPSPPPTRSGVFSKSPHVCPSTGG
jgi:hypothetical protein